MVQIVGNQSTQTKSVIQNSVTIIFSILRACLSWAPLATLRGLSVDSVCSWSTLRASLKRATPCSDEVAENRSRFM